MPPHTVYELVLAFGSYIKNCLSEKNLLAGCPVWVGAPGPSLEVLLGATETTLMLGLGAGALGEAIQ